jgi:hypothetical protein
VQDAQNRTAGLLLTVQQLLLEHTPTKTGNRNSQMQQQLAPS